MCRRSLYSSRRGYIARVTNGLRPHCSASFFWFLGGFLALAACGGTTDPSGARETERGTTGLTADPPAPVRDDPASSASARDDIRQGGVESAGPPTRVFFIGHSLQNWTVPSMVASFARAAELPLEWSAQIGNGAPLRWLWEHAGRSEGENARQVLPARPYDALVLTEAIPLADHVRWSDSDGFLFRFLELARRGNPRCRVYLYETWHPRDEGDWRARLDSDRAMWEGIADRVNRRQDGIDVRIIPAGQAMAALHDRIAEVPGIESMDDLFHDAIHLNYTGWYFVALVQYATVFRRSPIGLPAATVDRYGQPHPPPPREAVPALQAIAWEVVRRDPRSGVSD